MGIGLIILFWVAVAALLLAAYLGLARASRRWPRARSLKKVFVAVVAALVVPVIILAALDFAGNFFPGRVFKASFGFSPPPGVAELEGRKVVLGDGGEAYLRFKADKPTVERLIGGRFRLHAGMPSFPPSTPDYWKPVSTPSTRYYRADRFDDSFAFSQAFLIYDEATGVVHFHWSGVD
ncbi:MAG TPA: hypothetical protein VEZ40_00515 [Pyrinomonadaceae bacterium]|nr:hypothetical protein [Pyrinomonadaceae bacterium]